MALDQPDDRPDHSLLGRLDDGQMSLGEHLEELRARLLLALIGPVVAGVGTLYFGREIVGWLVQPLAQVLRNAGQPPQAYFRSPAGGFSVYLKVSLVAALIIASPWIIYQLWKFVEAGLYRHERKVVLAILPFSATMAGLGVLFMYYVMLPVCLAFLIFFSASYPAPDVSQPGEGSGPLAWLTHITAQASGGLQDAAEGERGLVVPGEGGAEGQPETVPGGLPGVRLPVLREDPAEPTQGQAWIKLPERELRVYFGNSAHSYAPLTGSSLLQPLIEVGDYINFVTLLAVGILIAFQLPVLMLILGWSGVIAPDLIAGYRRYCVFACFVLGAVFTPADPVSMFVLALPLWALFELGLLLMRLTYREPAAS